MQPSNLIFVAAGAARPDVADPLRDAAAGNAGPGGRSGDSGPGGRGLRGAGRPGREEEAAADELPGGQEAWRRRGRRGWWLVGEATSALFLHNLNPHADPDLYGQIENSGPNCLLFVHSCYWDQIECLGTKCSNPFMAQLQHQGFWAY